MEQGDMFMARCNNCVGQRKHFVVYCYKTQWEEVMGGEGPNIHGEDRYDLLQCAGCEAIMLRHTSIHSEAMNEKGNVLPNVHYYPPPTFRRLPTWLYAITVGEKENFSIIWMPEFISRLMKEIYTALHADCLALAAMGIRALLESVIIDRVGDQGTFAANLNEFQKRGKISPHQKEILEATLELGHASIHRSYNPTRDDVTIALDITETLLHTIYVSQAQASALKKKIPPRQKKV